ncbi:hypothetical protein L226DRAFT_614349 [Lentinus tigrinus ALCF2SS1-7]|uniref:Peregrin n=1 Tax=Lentinus tigrinus ALCF2SS1-6 TaxID=1328759 RepID=A0A5C2S1F4_9APHY|nr:hypothetical protein L227DRAFT_552352 [Lentinus tigrinus ALCF2SS1-6]RPD73093.1 hypothetical protein L226DRAFT_614349 [Lentinus tigrinus ALCF2SS1-7]
MARGVSSPAPNPLPRVSFVKVSDEVNQKNPGVHDNVSKTYGYNDGSEFQRPEYYIRYIEPLESDLAVQVEYDMDEQDQEWLDALNNDRKSQQLDKVSYETFEIVMDRLEKEWFDLTKNIPKSDMGLPSEDSTCAICDDSEGENTNAIVFCDGCNLAVHQDCYGVPYIPEGQWLCRKCTVSPENPVACILCPNEGGAFKQTVSGDWVHLLCAIWIPETSVANEVFMEPITGVEKISKQRWKLRCSVCEVKYGACVQCTKASCFTAFHATCARKEKFLMPMKATQGSEAPTLACYCEKHLPREQAEARAAMHRAELYDTDGDNIHPSPKSNKTARAYNKQYKPGPPLVPRIIVHRILQYISKIHIRHKPEFVNMVCKYWSLKREARRGAPLLKRLHLEPWTASPGSKQQTDEEKAMKLDHMKRLRLDLERLRIIADVVQRRERNKRDQADAIQSVLLHFFFPHEGFLRLAFENITSLDRQEYFKSPVSKVEVPDYYDIIKNPMCWDMIDSKLDRHEYLDLAEFKRDIYLVLNNAKTYNQSNTAFYRTAVRIQAAADAELAKLDRLMHHPAPSAPNPVSSEPILPPEPVPPNPAPEPVPPNPAPEPVPPNMAPEPVPPNSAPEPALPGSFPSESVDVVMESIDTEVVEEKPNITATPEPVIHDDNPPPIGDLEPPLDILDLLVSEEAVRHDTDYIMTSAPIQSLLNYELPLIRPPPPPPPPLPAPRQKIQKPQPAKAKIDRKTAIERKKQERKQALDASPGFRAPRTRAAMAAAAAFEAEATGSGTHSQTPELEESVAGPSSSGGQTPGSDRPRRGRKSAAEKVKDVPIAVEDVDSRQSFKMFEVGWILPAEQRRGGRAPLERGPVPPPRKRAKHSHDKSRLSNVSPAPAPSDSQSAPVERSVEEMPAPGASIAESVAGTDASHAKELPPPGEAGPPHVSTPIAESAPPGAVEVPQSDVPDPPEASYVPADHRTSPSPRPNVAEEPAAPAPTNTEEQPEVPSSMPASAPEAKAGEEDAMDTEPTDLPQPLEASTPASPPQRQPSLVSSEVTKAPPQPVLVEPEATAVPMEVDEAAVAQPDVSAEEGRVETIVESSHEVTLDEDPKESPEEASVDKPGEAVSNVIPDAPVVEPVHDAAKPQENAPSPTPVKNTEAESKLEPTQALAGKREPEAPAGPEAAPATESQPQPKPEEEEEEEDNAPRKIIWIETLDTPAIRREKSRRQRAEKQAKLQRAAAEAAAAERRAKGLPSPEPEPQPAAGPSKSQKQTDDAMDVDNDSDLTDLSDLESEEGSSAAAPAPAPALPPPPPPAPPKPARRNRWRPPEPDEPGVINLGPGEKVEGGTLVWAKLDSYPWWPAVVFEDDDKEVPKSVRGRCPAPGDNSVVLVRFYEKNRKNNNWAWVRLRNLRYLGEDDALDAQMLAPASKYQHWRNNSRRTECRNAYQDALAEMEAEDEAAMQAAQDAGADLADALGADSPMTDVEEEEE